MDYNGFFDLIKTKSLKGAYLLHGEEEFVKDSAIRSVVSLIGEDVRAFNYENLTEPEESSIIESCETLPLFSDFKLVICQGLSSGIDNDKLIEYLKNVPETTVLLIVLRGNVNEKSKLLKHFRSTGREVLFAELGESEVIKWCMSFAVRNGVGMDKNSARLLVGLVGVDMTAISNEMGKAVDMAGPGGVITPDIISKCTVSNIEVKIFEMLDCFTAGKVRDGMKMLHALLEDENEALGIASFLESRFKIMLEGRRLLDTGLQPRAAAQQMEGSRYANEKACKAACRYSCEQLAAAVKKFAGVGYTMMSRGGKASSMIETIMLEFDW